MKSRVKADTSLRAYVERAAQAAEKVFYRHGHIGPIWHFVDGNGNEVIRPAPPTPDKDIAVLIMRAIFELRCVTRYVFIDEAWIVDSTTRPHIDMESVTRHASVHGLRDYPGRQEVLMFAAEDRAEGGIMARRLIERPPGAKPKLGPLIIDTGGHMEGRMVGMLPSQPGEKMQ